MLSEYHDSLEGGGHQGFDRTYYALKSKVLLEWDVCRCGQIYECKECHYAKRNDHSQPAPLPVAAVFQR